jgi:ribosomal protein S1
MVAEGVPSDQIVSRKRAHLMREAAERPSIPETFYVGATLTGLVTSVVRYGMFVEIDDSSAWCT